MKLPLRLLRIAFAVPTIGLPLLAAESIIPREEMNRMLFEIGLPVLPDPSQVPPKVIAQSISLFAETDYKLSLVQSAGPSLDKRARLASINPAWLSSRNARFHLNLFEDASYPAIIEKMESHGATHTYFGRIESFPQSRVILTKSLNAVAGYVSIPGKASYRLGQHPTGLHSIAELGQSDGVFCTLCENPDFSSPKHSTDGFTQPPISQVSVLSETPVIDIMVLYSPAARAFMGSDPSGIRTSICLEIAASNDLFKNSKINARLRLIHMRELNYVENAAQDYHWLTNEADNVFVEIPPLADSYGADQVFLIGSYGLGSGATGQQLTQTTSSKYARLSVPDVFGARYIFAHELGHNLGCDHFREFPSSTGRYFPYSFGLILEFDTEFQYATVMVPGFNPEDRIPNYSNPLVFYTNVTTGTWLPTGKPEGDPDAADNARTINFTAPIVEAYKNLVPATLSGSRVINGGQVFAADITGPPNSLCEVQFTGDFLCWEPLIQLTISSAGTATFTDPGFATVSHRFYRVQPFAP